ncbi:hypothetical protein HC251_00870 [Iamia sp. SCSIO 61187]|uniref:hypothetical protein n=1 Tax=Iamia sp. SCSIO 61187 TaxID=2722752 RepID=UPI001C638971|nr:hypothetical protein [Iamia sp. SCSIO 61187]QYG91125.1 hypothetical protein HC251_00870 [Iamia sp. SCSIO 61187]
MVDQPPHPAPPAPPASPAEPAWPPLAPALDPPPVGAIARLSMVGAGLALLCYLVAGVLLAVPVETPGVQDCGAPGAYLLAGRVDVVPDPDGRILGPDGEVVTLDADVAAAARTEPCRDRVADRAVPAGLLLTLATVLGVVAFATELFVVRPRQRRVVRAARAAERDRPTDPTPGGPPAARVADRESPWGAPPGPSGG